MKFISPKISEDLMKNDPSELALQNLQSPENLHDSKPAGDLNLEFEKSTLCKCISFIGTAMSRLDKLYLILFHKGLKLKFLRPVFLYTSLIFWSIRRMSDCDLLGSFRNFSQRLFMIFCDSLIASSWRPSGCDFSHSLARLK